MNIKVIVATHKKYQMPEDDIYLPVFVGASGKESIGYQRDDEGENISSKNSYYCELTGLYWAWKNLECDYLGLAHYRRHFCTKRKRNVWDAVLSSDEANDLCSHNDIILPAKRKYYIETLYSHYAHTFHSEHLDTTRAILEEKFPEYIKAYDVAVNRTSGYMFNMFIMRKELVDEYCSFLFEVLRELEKRIEVKDLSAFHSRFYGRVSEILFNVWLTYKMEMNSALKVQAISFLYMEKVNWIKKGSAFLMAKFLGKKYEKSF